MSSLKRDRDNVICHSLWMMRSECFLNLQDAKKAAGPDRVAKGEGAAAEEALDLGDSCEAAVVAFDEKALEVGLVRRAWTVQQESSALFSNPLNSSRSLKIRFGMVQAGAKRCTVVFSPLTQPMF
jgi:hypothetical protein